jgi:hypothetical protein
MINPLVKKCKPNMLLDLHDARARSDRTGVPTGLGRSAFGKGDGIA